MNDSKSIIIYFFFLIIFIIKILGINSLAFPIKSSSNSYIKYLNSKIEETQNLDLEKIIKYIFENKIISTISIGTPYQKMTIFFSNNDNSLYLSKDPEITNDKFLIDHNFVRILSSTFILKNVIKYEQKKYNIVHLGQENILFDSKSKINFQILVENDKENKPNYYGIIGIGLNKDKEILNYPKFLNQLYDKGIIKNYYWHINYAQNKLIIGEEDDDLFNNYSQEILSKPFIDIYNDFSIMDWNILFTEVYMSSNSEENKFIIHSNTSNLQGNLKFDFGFILGTPRYRIFLNEKFFNKLIEENKCYEHKYSSKNKYKANYYLYTCNKSFESEIKKKFQSIKFSSNEFNYIFELNYDDLFVNIKRNKFLLFMIVFEVIDMNTVNYYRWILGEPFLRKYKFIFNPNKKTIIFQKQKMILEVSSKNNYNVCIKFIFIVLIILVIIYIVFKFIKMKKINSQNRILNNGKNIYNINEANINSKQPLELKDSLLLNNDIKIATLQKN